jgi:hypothetical protein
MNNYIGAKIIKAELSNLKDYKIKKYGKDAKINDGDEQTECYIVVYPPIGNGEDKPYLSMSPKDVFENAYREVHENEIGLLIGNISDDFYEKLNESMKEYDETLKKLAD